MPKINDRMVAFVKRPIPIKAWQFTKNNFKEGAPWEIRHSETVTLWSQFGGDVIGGEIKTLEGTMTVSENDYIILGTHGEFYPCKASIFESNYEKV